MSTPLQPADIAALVTSEVAAAVATADTGGYATVTKVVVRVGEPAASFDDVSWQVELTVDPRERRGQVLDGRRATTARIPAAIADMPVSAISGVSSAWSGKLASVGIVSIGDLARVDHRVLARLAHADRSRRVFTLASRARLCALEFVPPITNPELTIRAAIALSPADLAQSLGLDEPGSIALTDVLSRLIAALDAVVLDEMVLDWLFD